MLTARAEEADKVAGLDAGADDYLTKPFSTQGAAGAHPRGAAPQGARGAGQPPSRSAACASTRRRGGSPPGDQEVKLGPTEFRLLHFLMTHPERVHSRAQLLDRVWGDHVFIEERTVDVHVKRLREALDAGRRARMIETVRGAGYRLTQQARPAPPERWRPQVGQPMRWLLSRRLAPR